MNVENNIPTFEKLAIICKPIGLQKIGNNVGFLHDDDATRNDNLVQPDTRLSL